VKFFPSCATIATARKMKGETLFAVRCLSPSFGDALLDRARERTALQGDQ